MDEQTCLPQKAVVSGSDSPGARGRVWWRADTAFLGQHHGQNNPPRATLILNTVHPPQKQDRACPGVSQTGKHTQGLLIQPFYLDGDQGSIPGLGRSSGEGRGNPLQYSCLENSMDREAWRATVHGVAKSQTQLSN